MADDVPESLIGDPVRLRAALENLIDNAVKFTEQGAVRLEVQARRAPRAAAPSRSWSSPTAASDSSRKKSSGCSVRSRKQAQRSRAATAALASVFPSSKVLAKLMGGDLTVTSDAGPRLALLLLGRSAGRARHSGGSFAGARNRSAGARGLKILCAEDNPYGRVILNTILTELGHHADFAGVRRGSRRCRAARL